MKTKKLFMFVWIITLTLSFLFTQPKPVDPVNWRELIPFLIDLPGWESDEKPKGQSMSMQNFKLSQVERRYTSGDKRLDIEIIDGSYIPMVYASFKMMSNFEVDTSEEYIKKTTIKKFPAIEQYKYNRQRATLTILVADRFLVKLEEQKVKDTSEIKTISESLDLEKLAKLAK